MSSLGRIRTIIRADFRVRFRRVSTAIVFLLLSAFAYVWLPAPSTGRALIQINGHRAIYNSGAIGMGTASLGMMFVGLFGYYVISNAIRARHRHTLRSSRRLDSDAFDRIPSRKVPRQRGVSRHVPRGVHVQLDGDAAGARRSAARAPRICPTIPLLLTPAAVTLVSAVAVLFESIPLLAGKLGDVAYFFLYMMFFGLVVADETSGGRVRWARYLDFTGFGFMIQQMQHTLHTEEISIGSSAFDRTKTPIIFPGLSMTADWLMPRIVATLLPLLLLPLAALVFHRFDPMRVGRTAGKSNQKWIGKLQSLLKPLTRRAVASLMVPARGGSFAVAVWSDAVLTLTLFPLASLAFVGISITTFAAPAASILPVTFAVVAIIISDVATRDVRAGAVASLYAVPRLRETSSRGSSRRLWC